MKQYLPKYVNALCEEMDQITTSLSKTASVGTVFFGGGTPSLLSVDQVSQLLNKINKNFSLDEFAEITLEANPGTVTPQYITDLYACGVTRLSFGMQSSHPQELQILDRSHRHMDVIDAVKWSRQAGFDHINLDLIFGIPGQSLQSWEESLALACMSGVDHFSLYSLIVEDGTPMKNWIDHGLIDQPDDDLSAAMYEYAEEYLSNHGFLHYEISNWAKNPEARCRHNLQYWRYLPYFGLGAGAHGFFNGVRVENEGKILPYINLIYSKSQQELFSGSAVKDRIHLSKWDQMQEFMMVGFRLTDEGVSDRDFAERFGVSFEEIFSSHINLLKRQKLIEVHPLDQDRLRLTQKGRLFGNRVFSEFVGNEAPSIID